MSSSLSSTFIPRLSARKKKIALGIPLRLRGRPAYLAPTGYGLVFFTMLLALLVGSINHNSNLGYLLTFLLGSMAFVSVFHTVRNLSGFRVSAVKAEPVFAGQKASFAITVLTENQTRPGISFSLPGGETTTVTLQEGSRQSFTVPLDTDRRGILKIPLLKMETSYPLRFFRVWSSLAIQGSCLVYPEPAPGPLVTASDSADDESEGESGGSGVEDFSSLAEYQRGDPLQHISWKAYSRGQGLYTKKFEGQQGKTIYFDPDVLAGQDMELKLSRICFMIVKADNLRLTYGLRLGSKVIPPGFGGSHKRRCLMELALFGRKK